MKNRKKFQMPIGEDHEEGHHINLYNIQKDATDQATTLNNRANIRTFMGTKSYENQEKIRSEKENKEKLAALEEARKQNVERQEEIKISKYLDLQKLGTTWKIQNKEKLKETIRNEIMKQVLKEEERKNFENMGGKVKLTEEESIKKSMQILKDKEQKKKESVLEPPKAYSPKSGKKAKKASSKKYKFSPEKVHKIAKESQEDYKKRYGFGILASPKHKELLDPVQQHKITKEFQELVVRAGVEKNGRLVI